MIRWRGEVAVFLREQQRREDQGVRGYAELPQNSRTALSPEIIRRG